MAAATRYSPGGRLRTEYRPSVSATHAGNPAGVLEPESPVGAEHDEGRLAHRRAVDAVTRPAISLARSLNVTTASSAPWRRSSGASRMSRPLTTSDVSHHPRMGPRSPWMSPNVRYESGGDSGDVEPSAPSRGQRAGTSARRSPGPESWASKHGAPSKSGAAPRPSNASRPDTVNAGWSDRLTRSTSSPFTLMSADAVRRDGSRRRERRCGGASRDEPVAAGRNVADGEPAVARRQLR